MEIFKYLKADKPNSLLNKYGVESLTNKIIIQNNKDNKFYVFNDKYKFQEFIYNLEEKERTFNEVILDNKQKFRIDLDYEKDDDETITDENMKEFIEII